jgi:hypothetical protein
MDTDIHYSMPCRNMSTMINLSLLNPENGHRFFLPYIILVVDEFADLI